MKKEIVERYVWTKEEIRPLLIEDLTTQGIKIQGENALRFTDMVAILEVWPSRVAQDETSVRGEGEKEGVFKRRE